jgi:PAS domain S-box-containing protein
MREEATEKMHREHEALQSIFRSLAEGVIVADKDGNFLFFNHIAEKILGIGSKAVASDEWSSVYGCFYPDKITPYPSEQLPLARALRNEVVNSELIFIKNPERPEGLYIDISARPINDNNGSVQGGTVIFRDITATKRAELLHKQSTDALKKLSNAVEQTADSVIITDKHGIVEYVNPAFEETTGYSRESIIGQSPRILNSGIHSKVFYKEIWKTILAGEPWRGTITNKKKSGDIYWCEQTITPMKDDEGNITNFVSVMKDITELKEKHEQEFRLRVAREVQQRLYKAHVNVPGYDIGGAAFSAVETGGDYFDFIEMPDGNIGLIIGDVCGHGIGSALIMAATRAYLRAFAKLESDPGVILTRVNRELAADLDKKLFVTLILIRLDPKRHRCDYASAGHVPAYLLDGSGKVVHRMKSTGIPLGIMQEAIYHTSNPLEMEEKNILALLTDGITEAHTPGGAEFGMARALGVIRRHNRMSAQQIVTQLYQTVRDFAEKMPQEDDITSIICKLEKKQRRSG